MIQGNQDPYNIEIACRIDPTHAIRDIALTALQNSAASFVPVVPAQMVTMTTWCEPLAALADGVMSFFLQCRLIQISAAEKFRKEFNGTTGNNPTC